MYLLALPNETILKILSLLSIKDLANTALVSRQFYDLTQPSLYRHLVIRCPIDPGSTSSLSLLLRTLLPSCTGKTRDTRSLNIRNETFDHDYHMPYSTHLMQLLALLPRLEYLELGPLYDPSCSDAFFDCFQARCPSRLPVALQHLSEFRSTDAEPDAGLSVEFLVLLMGLPNLRILAVCVYEIYEPEEMMFKDAASTSRITELELVCSEVSHKILSGILSIPQSLTSFIYRLPSNVGFHLGELGLALLPLQKSLKHLVLDFSRVGPEEHIDSDDGTIGTFQHWGRLETLDCSFMMLYGRADIQDIYLGNLLPAGLNTLTLRTDDYWSAEEVVQHMVLLVQDLHTLGLEALRRVAVGSTGYHQCLSSTCDTAGVLVEFME